jgi:RNA polymerase sigma-70 factor (ECF subfamily)
MGNRELAEDILQEGFVVLFTKLGSYSASGSFEGWARKIFINTALMSLRKKDVMKMSDDIDSAVNVRSETSTPVENIGYKELLKLISGLPPGYRIIFNMYTIEGYTHKEIADSLGISENTSRSQLHRARIMLQEKIKELSDVKR